MADVVRPSKDHAGVWENRNLEPGFIPPTSLTPERYKAKRKRYWLPVDKSRRYLWDNHWMALRPEHAANLRHIDTRKIREVELVPEPHNQVDPTAVAVYVGRRRIGYLQASKAYQLHDILAAHNHHGRAVIATGDDTYIELPRDITEAHIEESGLGSDCRRFLQHTAEDVVPELLGRTQYSLKPEEITALRKRRRELKYLSWPKTHSYAPASWESGKGQPYIPPALEDEIYKLWKSARRKAREWERQERARLREEHAAERERLRAAKAAERQLRDAKIVSLYSAGWSQVAVSRELGISQTTVANVLRQEGLSSGGLTNQESSLARAHRAIDIADLQMRGLSRSQIGEHTGLSLDSIKGYLRDGRFYSQPEEYPQRLRETLSSAKPTPSASPVERRRWRDRGVLHELRPDLFEMRT